MERTIPVALTIAGSDSGGGAGIQADLKTFTALGVYGASVITALTAQNARGITAVSVPEPGFVLQQFEAVMTGVGADAAKTGMLADEATLEVVCEALERWPVEKLVVDPVLVSSSGRPLLQTQAIESFRRRMIPMAYLLTPNIPEAEALAGDSIGDLREMERAARSLIKMGASAVLVKGGHLPDSQPCTDLYFDGKRIEVFESPRTPGGDLHGTGCTLSAAVAAMLAGGMELIQAIGEAKRFTTRCIESSRVTGSGGRSLNHVHGFRPLVKE